MSMWCLFGGFVGFITLLFLPVAGCIGPPPEDYIQFAVFGAIIGLAIGQLDHHFCSTVVRDVAGDGPPRPRKQFNIKRLLLFVTVASLLFALFAGIRHQRELAWRTGVSKSYRDRRSSIEAARVQGIAPVEYDRLCKELDEQYRRDLGYVPVYPPVRPNVAGNRRHGF